MYGVAQRGGGNASSESRTVAEIKWLDSKVDVKKHRIQYTTYTQHAMEIM